MKIKDMKGKGLRKKERTVLRCPQCGSDNITYELGLITGYKYFCKDCQYVGPLVIQDSGGREQGPRDKVQGATNGAKGAGRKEEGSGSKEQG